MSYYATSGCLGVDLLNEHASAKHRLGERVTASDGSVWVYVKAGAAITDKSWVAIDEDWNAVMGTKALADAGDMVGFAQRAFTSAYFGWVAVHMPGTGTVRVLASCLPNVQLYTTSTAGALDDTSASQTLLRGVVLKVSATNTASVRECMAVYPNATATP